MIDSPYFSVIIPTYDRARALDRALESLSTQTCRDFEVIVCDDGSTDGTRQVCERWGAVLNLCYLFDTNSGGPARPRNNGLAVARGSWICFLDSDDWWYPTKLERVRAFSGNADVVYHDCHCFAGAARRKRSITGRSLSAPVFDDLMVGWNPLVTSTTCVRKSILELTGGFDESRQFTAVEDFDLWLKVSRVTERFLHVSEVLGVYELGDGNISQFSELSLARESAVFERHAPFLDGDRQTRALKMIRYRQGLIYWHLGQGRKSREMFLEALLPERWRHRLLVVLWIMATFLRRNI